MKYLINLLRSFKKYISEDRDANYYFLELEMKKSINEEEKKYFRNLIGR